MISVIIASADKTLLANVSENIKSTIGVEFEIIGFDNANAEKGICEVYNIGITKAKYGILCFMHEDILIKTPDWGKIVEQCFHADGRLGLIGIAGSCYKAAFPSSWFTWLDKANRFNLIQRSKYSAAETKFDYNNPYDEKSSAVAAIDGVWFCTRKAVVSEIKFDENLLKGFHGYDIDFSLSVGQSWDVAVTFEVLIDHFSEGFYDAKWIESTLLVHQKWNKILPKNSGTALTKKETVVCETKAFEFFIDRMIKEGYSKKRMYNVLWKSGLYKIFGWNFFLKRFRYLFSLKA